MAGADAPSDGKAATAASVVRLERTKGRRGLGFTGLWRDRELLFFLAQRDIKVRYKQTFFGAAWALGQPLLMMVVFTLIFGRVAGLPSDDLPYEVFVLSGLVPWGLVSVNVPTMSTSLVSNEELITKVRIHSMLVPAAVIGGGLVDLGVATGLLLVIAGSYGVVPGPEALAIPLFAALGVAVALGVGLLLSSISVLYRDVRYAVPFGVQLWLFLTPVVYPTDEVSSTIRWLFALNPMVGVVEGFRWAVAGSSDHLAAVLPFSILGAVIILLGGAYVFRRLEPIFADVV